jgi:hypothetical protein
MVVIVGVQAFAINVAELPIIQVNSEFLVDISTAALDHMNLTTSVVSLREVEAKANTVLPAFVLDQTAVRMVDPLLVSVVLVTFARVNPAALLPVPLCVQAFVFSPSIL